MGQGFRCGALLCGLATSALAQSAGPDYPVTATASGIDSFGISWADPFRWMERPQNLAMDACASPTRFLGKYMEAIPGCGVRRRRALDSKPGIRDNLSIHGGHLLYTVQPTSSTLLPSTSSSSVRLAALDHIGGSEVTLYDPDTQNGDAIKMIEGSPDGDMVAYTTTQTNGDESISVVTTADATQIAGPLPNVGGTGNPAALAWDYDEKGFLHTLWPSSARKSGTNSGPQVFHYVLGPNPTDTPVFVPSTSANIKYHLATSVDGKVQALVTTTGSGTNCSVYLRSGNGSFTMVATTAADIVDTGHGGGAFVGDKFYAISTKNDPEGEVISFVPGQHVDPPAKPPVVVPASAANLLQVIPFSGGFITLETKKGEYAARTFGSNGTPGFQIPIPAGATKVAIAGDPQRTLVVIRCDSGGSITWISYDPIANQTGPSPFKS